METINSGEHTKYTVKPKIKDDKNEEKDPSFVANLSYYFAEYCQTTSLHGLKFLGERGRSVVEKLWWLTVIAVSLYFCIIYIMSTYQKWQMYPVIVNFATSQTPISKIPFPAVTICPETKSDSRAFNYSNMHSKWRNNSLTPEEIELYGYMNLLCVNREKLTTSFVDEEMLDFITNLAPTLKDTLWKCRWMTFTQKCSHLFVPVITEAGVCFSFNILDHRDMYTSDVYRYKNFQSTNKIAGWSPSDGYGEDDDLDAYPQRAQFSSAKAGLALTLEITKADIDHICSGGMQGYRVHLHHPSDMPSIEENYFTVPLDQAVSVAIKPRVMTTNEKLVSYPPEQRQCYFVNDKPLRFFKIYSQQNCLVECLTNFTFNACECVAFYMPRTNSTPICGAGKKKCLVAAEAIYQRKQVNNIIQRWVDEIPSNYKNLINNCNCLSPCLATNYDEETSQTPWDWKHYYDSEDFRHRKKLRPTQNSKLIIYFKDRQVISSQRNELYGNTDFIASCGGLLGLFIGFSFISFIELVYFVTLRFACNLRKFGRYYWSGDPEMLNH